MSSETIATVYGENNKDDVSYAFLQVSLLMAFLEPVNIVLRCKTPSSIERVLLSIEKRGQLYSPFSNTGGFGVYSMNKHTGLVENVCNKSQCGK